jgi:dsRNA-specific ribonuclease
MFPSQCWIAFVRRDSYIKMIVSLHIFLNNPELNEGQLTSVRHGIVSNENLRIIAAKNAFPRYLVLQTPTRRRWKVCHVAVPPV